jgi:transposase
VFNILEAGRTIILANARHMKAVPGRKTDLKESEWIADLLRHGLLQASFIPPEPIREVRELTRYRKTLVQERADEINRMQKVLETANVKLASVATDVLGKSGRHMQSRVGRRRTGSSSPGRLGQRAASCQAPTVAASLGWSGPRSPSDSHHTHLSPYRLLRRLTAHTGERD